MKAERKTCPHCGQNVLKHRHGLTRSLVQILINADRFAKSSFHLDKDLMLSKSAYTNFSHLKYWNFVERDPDVTGSYKITNIGYRFLCGSIKVQRFVWIYNNKVVEREGEEMGLLDFGDLPFGYKQREQWAEDAVPYKNEKDQFKFI